MSELPTTPCLVVVLGSVLVVGYNALDTTRLAIIVHGNQMMETVKTKASVQSGRVKGRLSDC